MIRLAYATHETDWGWDGKDEIPYHYYFANHPRFVWNGPRVSQREAKLLRSK